MYPLLTTLWKRYGTRLASISKSAHKKGIKAVSFGVFFAFLHKSKNFLKNPQKTVDKGGVEWYYSKAVAKKRLAKDLEN